MKKAIKTNFVIVASLLFEFKMMFIFKNKKYLKIKKYKSLIISKNIFFILINHTKNLLLLINIQMYCHSLHIFNLKNKKRDIIK